MNTLGKVAFAALALASVGTADAAMTVNSRGLGQVLLYPFYSAGNATSRSTLVTLVNTSERAKVVQLTFREGVAAVDVLTVRLFLGPRDAWNGTVFGFPLVSFEGPNLIANDRGCAVPITYTDTRALPDGRRYWVFARGLAVDPPGWDQGRLGTGAIEAIELGEIKIGSALETAVTSQGDGVPSCAGVDTADLAASLDAPGGKLFGNYALVNAATGRVTSGAATAIDGFSVVPLVDRPIVDLSHGRTSANASDPVEAGVDVGGRRLRVTYPPERAIDAVSAVLMSDAVYGDFAVDPAAGAKTDWLLSMPTRRFYVAGATNANRLAREPFASRSHATLWRSQPCSYYGADVRDRDQHAIAPRTTFLTPPVLPPKADAAEPKILFEPYPSRASRSLCNAVEVVAFSRYRDVPDTFHASAVIPYKWVFELIDESVTATGGDARLRLGLPDPTPSGTSGTTPAVLPAGVEGPALRGLPVIGIQSTLYVNTSGANGATFEYTTTAPLRSEAACAASDGSVIACP